MTEFVPEEEEESSLTPLQQDIYDAIKNNPSSDDRTIAQIVFSKNHPGEKWEGKDPAFQYVMKIRKRIAILSKPPEIKVEKEKPVEIPEAPEEKEGKPLKEQFAVPYEEEKKPIEPLTEIDKLRPIFQRSITRLGDVLIKRFANVKEGSISQQEAEDTEILVFAVIAKYAHVALEEYYLEVTSLMHFSSLVLRTIAQRREQKEKEKPIPKPTKTPEQDNISAGSSEKAKLPPEPEKPKLFKKGETTPNWAKEHSALELKEEEKQDV